MTFEKKGVKTCYKKVLCIRKEKEKFMVKLHSPVVIRPSLMDLHHQANYAQFRKTVVIFEPIT